jgi:DNA mismatch repair protein MutL
VKDVRPAGCPAGTCITVKELFFNTPARYKFLKKDTTEAGFAADILTRIALSHPEISFTFTNNGRKVMHTPGNGDLKSVIFSIYGAETVKHLAYVDYEDEGIRITGFAGLAETARSSRVNQSVYINKRYIRNKTVTSAIDAAYSTFVMKNRYPFIVLNIGIEPSRADVNVHPAKLEVKFSNEQDMFRAVYHAVSNALLSYSGVRALPGTDRTGDSKERGYKETAGHARAEAKITGGRMPAMHADDKASGRPSYTQQEFEWVRKELDRKYQEAISGRFLETVPDGQWETLSDKDREAIPDEDRSAPEESHKTLSEEYPETAPERSGEADGGGHPEQDASGLFDNTRIIGQIFSTYILLEGADELYLLDQHAAHERIRYEKLKRAYSQDKPLAQMLLSPVHVSLTGSEYEYAMSESGFFEKLGFTFDSFGTNSVIIRSAPLIGENMDAMECFIETLDFVMKQDGADKSLIADEALYRLACKSAVKARDKLDEKEIEALLAGLAAVENPYTCPHGRPAIFKIRRYDLEKLFKRIV